ncbi:hypothetical protein FTX61_08315 [Nitriliruptoraceae bacterium ZYF776]|nr:hypothetical protein [Profundirhabdus halotolerans]
MWGRPAPVVRARWRSPAGGGCSKLVTDAVADARPRPADRWSRPMRTHPTAPAATADATVSVLRRETDAEAVRRAAARARSMAGHPAGRDRAAHRRDRGAVVRPFPVRRAG